MYEHEDLVDEGFPKPGGNYTRLSGDVIRFPMSDNTRKILRDTAPTEPTAGVPGADIIPIKKPK